MAEIKDDPHVSFETGTVGIGQNVDGTFNSFPLADLKKKTAERDSEEAATQFAMEQSEEGFPDLSEPDISDLDEYDDLFEA